MLGIFDETVVQADSAEGDFFDEIRKCDRQADGRTVEIFIHGGFRGHDIDFAFVCMKIRIVWKIDVIDDERIFIISVYECLVDEKVLLAFWAMDAVQRAFEERVQGLNIIVADDGCDAGGRLVSAMRADDGFLIVV